MNIALGAGIIVKQAPLYINIWTGNKQKQQFFATLCWLKPILKWLYQ